jgi:hypothetical protein
MVVLGPACSPLASAREIYPWDAPHVEPPSLAGWPVRSSFLSVFTAFRFGPTLRRPTIGLLLIFALSSPFLSDSRAGDSALAGWMGLTQPTGPFRITTPVDGATVGDGNILLIEGVATDRLDGVVDRIEVAFGTAGDWIPARRSSEDASKWSATWADPPVGFHRIRARAFGVEDLAVIEQSIIVQVADVWTTTYVIDNPYAVPGSFRKGQLHVHSTRSFDGWNSMPAGNLAVAYQRRGYEFILLTDHDVVSYPTEVNNEDFLVIPGYESTADTGHITGMFVNDVVSPAASPQDRINHIVNHGGLAILNHPGWTIGWRDEDFRRLSGYFGFEIFNAMTSAGFRSDKNAQLWHDVLNTRGYANRVWAMAVDDAHEPRFMDVGWTVVKSAELSLPAVRRALENGSFYASNGPSFTMLGVMSGSIAAASPEASVIRFIDQDLKTIYEGPASGASYHPRGTERWIRVEAIMEDGRTAWSQPFWLMPNAPHAALVPTFAGMALTGTALPGARVHVSDKGQYLGSAVANQDGVFAFRQRSLQESSHEFWVIATAPWPDQLSSAPTLLQYGD